MTSQDPVDIINQVTLNDLSDLMVAEYHVKLEEFLENSDLRDEENKIRLGRLMGILLKEPFSEPREGDPNISRTGALRFWDIQEDKLKQWSNSDASKTEWQYLLLSSLKEESGFQSVQEFALDAKYERGFFHHLLKATRKYICGNEELKAKIEEARKESKTSLKLTPEALLGTTGSMISTALILSVPWLTPLAAPIITGLVIIIGSIGTEAFCSWSEEYIMTYDTEKIENT